MSVRSGVAMMVLTARQRDLTEELRMLHAHLEFDRDHRKRWEAATHRVWFMFYRLSYVMESRR